MSARSRSGRQAARLRWHCEMQRREQLRVEVNLFFKKHYTAAHVRGLMPQWPVTSALLPFGGVR